METISYPTNTTAKKEHNCNFCSEKIRIGEVYIKSTYKDEGEVYDWKTHKHCSDLATRLKMYDYAEEGVTQEHFMETIDCEHDDLLINQLPKTDVPRYSDIIQQLRCVRWKDKLGYVMRYYIKLDKANETVKIKINKI